MPVISSMHVDATSKLMDSSIVFNLLSNTDLSLSGD